MNSCEVSFLNAVNVLQMDQEGGDRDIKKGRKRPITCTVFPPVVRAELPTAGLTAGTRHSPCKYEPKPHYLEHGLNLLKNYVTTQSILRSLQPMQCSIKSTVQVWIGSPWQITWSFQSPERLPNSKFKALMLFISLSCGIRLGPELRKPPWVLGQHHGGEKPDILYCWKMKGWLIIFPTASACQQH